MTENQLTEIEHWFNDYVSNFYGDSEYSDRNQNLKDLHCRRVSALCQEIAASIPLDGDEIRLSKAAGLLHDIGRFEQFRQYSTFNDKLSVDHGQLGETILIQNNPLQNLPKWQQFAIQTAVACHGRRELPHQVDNQALQLLKIVRDADKLDILALLTTHYQSPESGTNPALDLEMPNQRNISPETAHDILSGRCVNLNHVRSIHDFRVLQISWIYDLNFTFSRHYLRSKGHIDQLLRLLPPGEPADTIAQHVKRRQNSI